MKGEKEKPCRGFLDRYPCSCLGQALATRLKRSAVLHLFLCCFVALLVYSPMSHPASIYGPPTRFWFRKLFPGFVYKKIVWFGISEILRNAYPWVWIQMLQGMAGGGRGPGKVLS